MPRTATVRHGNVYIANRHLSATIRRLLKGRPTYVVLNEAGRVLDNPVVRQLLNRAGYRTYASPYGDPRGRSDVMLLVHKRAEHLGVITVRIMEARPGVSAAWHERYLVAALTDDPALGRTAIVGIHPSPAPEALTGTDPDHPLVKAYADGMRRTIAVLDYLDRAGYRIVVTGDVQLRPTIDRRWTADAALDTAGLTVDVYEHLDLIAANRRLEATDARVLAGIGQAGDNDHPLLTATYRKAT